MRLIRLALISILLFPFFLEAQTFEALRNKRGDNPFTENEFELMLRRTQVSGKYTTPFGGTTLNFRWRYDSYEKGGMRWHMENPTIGDFIFVIGKLLAGNDVTVRADEQVYGAGFLGWHQVYGNVIARDKMLFSVGATFGDYIFASTRATPPDGHTQRTLDPGGYFFTLGPAFMSTFMIGNSFWIDGYLHPDIGFRAAAPSEYEASPGKYPRPIFLNVGTNVHHAKTRTFLSVRFNHLIDRGANKDAATRLDISFGYSF
jgi:hypothetical protein